MKKLIMSLLLLTAASVQAQELKVNVKLETSNIPARVSVTLANPVDESVKTDTITVQNAAFAVATPSKVAQLLSIRSLTGGQYSSVLLRNLLVIPNQQVTITISEQRIAIEGGPFYEQWEKSQADLMELSREMLELEEQYYALGGNESVAAKAKRQELLQKGAELTPVMEARVEEYAKQNTDKPGAVYGIVALLHDPAAFIDTLPANIRNGVLSGYLNMVRQAYTANLERESNRQAAAQKLEPGFMAPEFTLNDLNGKPLALSSLRGKYVVLDFWGTWCIWCIRGVPKMKEYYAKYSSKMEILGIDCGDTEDVWKKGVERHQLPWKHVYNPCGTARDINPLYQVEGYPTKAIIDPEGKLVKIFTGESDEFYQMLDQLLK